MTQDEIQIFCKELNHSGISMKPNSPGDENGRINTISQVFFVKAKDISQTNFRDSLNMFVYLPILIMQKIK